MVSVADLRVEHEVKRMDFHALAWEGGRSATRSERPSADSGDLEYAGLAM